MNNKYRIAIFYDIYGKPNTGGTTVRPYNLVKMLLKFNIDFKVFCMNSPHPDYDIKGKIFNISQFNPKDFNIFWVENSLRVTKDLNDRGILPILGTNIIPNSAPMHALPYVDENGKSRQNLSVQNEKQIISTYKGKFWLSQSDFQEKEYRRLGLPYNVKVLRAPNPVDIKLFYPTQDKPKEFIIGWCGKNNWAKHAIFLKEIASYFPSIKFYCLSDNEFPKMNFGDNVKVMLRKTNKQVAELLKECSLFLSTSVTENQPLGVLEAMATGLPVIGFRTSGMPEIIEHNYNGKLVDLGNIEHFVVEINRFLQNKSYQNFLGFNARRYIIDNFSEKACIKQYLRIFDEYLRS